MAVSPLPSAPELPKFELPLGGDLPPAAVKEGAALADQMFVREMDPSPLAAPAREAVSAASDAVAAGVSIPWVGIGVVFVVFPILVVVVSELTKAPITPAEPEAPAEEPAAEEPKPDAE